MTNTTPSPETPSRFDNVKQHLARLRDELVVRNHLATLEVKEAVGSVASELDKLSQRVTHAAQGAAGDVKLQGHLALMDVKDRLNALEGVVQIGLQGAAQSPTFVSEATRLQLTLARMDATQVVDEKVKALKRDGQQLAHDSGAILTDLELQLGRLGAELSKLV